MDLPAAPPTAIGRELLGFIWAIGVRVEAGTDRAASLPA